MFSANTNRAGRGGIQTVSCRGRRLCRPFGKLRIRRRLPYNRRILPGRCGHRPLQTSGKVHTDSPRVFVKSVHPAGGQSRPPLQGVRRGVVGADDSVGPLESYEFAEDFRENGASCVGRCDPLRHFLRKCHLPFPRGARQGEALGREKSLSRERERLFVWVGLRDLSGSYPIVVITILTFLLVPKIASVPGALSIRI